MGVISMEDVEGIVSLLGHVAGMDGPIADRRRALMTGLCRSTGADAWLWVHSRFDRATGQSMFFSALDGGFPDDEQRRINLDLLIDPRVQDLSSLPIIRTLTSSGGHVTLTRPTMLSPELYDRPEFAEYRRHSNYDPGSWSLYLIGSDTWSAIGTLVAKGKPPPGDRERAILHLVLGRIDWLHRAGTDVPANSKELLELSGRQRQVLFLLMGGGSRKEIASKLGISQNTVADYLKSIYRRFSVNSRGELLAKFISGSASTRPPIPPIAQL